MKFRGQYSNSYKTKSACVCSKWSSSFGGRVAKKLKWGSYVSENMHECKVIREKVNNSVKKKCSLVSELR